MVDYRPYIDDGAFALDTAEAFFMPDDPYGDDWFLSEPPPDLDYTPDDDPWLPIDDRFVPTDAAPQFDMPPPGQDGLQGLEMPEPTDEGWAWQDARLIGVERVDDVGTQYEIGCMDVYANLNTGDLGGSYLPIASFGDADVAAVYYHDLQGQMHREGVASHEVPAFAEQAAAQIQLSRRPPKSRGRHPTGVAHGRTSLKPTSRFGRRNWVKLNAAMICPQRRSIPCWKRRCGWAVSCRKSRPPHLPSTIRRRSGHSAPSASKHRTLTRRKIRRRSMMRRRGQPTGSAFFSPLLDRRFSARSGRPGTLPHQHPLARSW